MAIVIATSISITLLVVELEIHLCEFLVRITYPVKKVLLLKENKVGRIIE